MIRSRRRVRPLDRYCLLATCGWLLATTSPFSTPHALGQSLGTGTARPAAGIADRRPELYALSGVRVVTSPGEVVDDATILISGQTVTAVGAELELPPGTEVIPMDGKTVYPGLIDLGGEAATTTSFGRGGHWNRYVTPEKSPSVDANAAQPLRDADPLRGQGITVRLLAPTDGIISGSSHAVLTGGPDSLAPVIRHHVAQHLQLTVPRGSARDVFPKSPMGAVALVRQCLLDAQWYRQALQAHQSDPNTPSPELDEALQRIDAAMRNNSFIIDCPNERFIGRADRLAREFSIAAVLKGSGREYRLLEGVAATGRTLLLPVAFPEAPEVTTVEDASDVSLTELMHWHLAPENPARLADAGVQFALTTADLTKPADFLKAVREAVRRGLDPNTALAALTTVPAEILQLENRLGTIHPGKLANLIVCQGDLFDDDAAVLETWVAGRRYRHHPETRLGEANKPLVGDWTLRLRGAKAGLQRLTMTLGFTESKSDEPPKPRAHAKLEGKLTAAEETTDAADDTDTDTDTDDTDTDDKTDTTDEQDSESPPAVKLANLTPQRDRLTATFKTTELDPNLPGGVARMTLRIHRPAEIPGSENATRGTAEIRLSGEFAWPDGTVTTLSVQRTEKAADDRPKASDDDASDQEEPSSDESESSDGEPDQTPDKQAEDKTADERPVDCPVNRPLGAYGVTEPPSQPEAVLFRGATLWTCGPEGVIKNADLLVRGGKIAQIGSDLQAPEGCQIVDAEGMHLTPGLIDCHSHIATDGGINEASRAVTADVRIGDFIDHSDITIYRHLAGGVTTSNILHGSANPIGGQNQVIKLRWGSDPEGLRFADAPQGIKFALGENVKRDTWRDGSSNRYPQSRMGVEQLLRDQFIAARQYDQDWRSWQAGQRRGLPPRRDLRLEAIAEVLRGDRWVHCHSYRQDEIAALLGVLQEFNVQIGTLQHVLEGYKVAEVLAEHRAMASTFADWWAYKMEVYDAIPYNAAVLQRRGIIVSMNSDDRELGRHLNTEAAKAVKYGGISETEALKMVTLNPAKQLRIDHAVGSLQDGKDADLVLWSGPPLSTFSRCEQTWIDGRQYFSREQDRRMQDEQGQLRAELIQRVLTKANDKLRHSPDRAADKPTAVAWVDEEARWPREDLYCSARRGAASDERGPIRDREAVDDKQPSLSIPAQP